MAVDPVPTSRPFSGTGDPDDGPLLGLPRGEDVHSSRSWIQRT